MKKKELTQKLERCIAMSRSMRIEGKISDAVSSTVENRVKVENSEATGTPIQSSSPVVFVDNAYHAFLGKLTHNNDSHSFGFNSDETLARHEEERGAGPSFEGASDGGGPIKPKQQIQCSLCGDVVSKQRSSMVYHANTRHGKYELYECGICHRKWQTIAKSDVIKHIKSHHERPDGTIDCDMVIDYRKNLGNKLKEITEKCFPERKKKRIGYTDLPE